MTWLSHAAAPATMMTKSATATPTFVDTAALASRGGAPESGPTAEGCPSGPLRGETGIGLGVGTECRGRMGGGSSSRAARLPSVTPGGSDQRTGTPAPGRLWLSQPSAHRAPAALHAM